MKVTDFYRQFLKPGDLVFDIGANIGDRTQIFHDLGASVVAVEAQPTIFDYLKNRFKDIACIDCVQAAVTDRADDTTKIYWSIPNEMCGTGTISRDWIQTAQKQNIWEDGQWDGSSDVKTTTLDRLVITYGVPQFIKIDTEGSEYNIICGLNRPFTALSFEYHVWDFQKVIRIFNSAILFPEEYEYNLSKDETFEFQFEKWTTQKETLAYMDPYLNGKTKVEINEDYGDIYVRRKQISKET